MTSFSRINHSKAINKQKRCCRTSDDDRTKTDDQAGSQARIRWVQSNLTLTYHPEPGNAIFEFEMQTNAFSAGALTRTPLTELYSAHIPVAG